MKQGPSQHERGSLLFVVGGVLLIFAWYLLAPMQFRGLNTYVTTYGISMLPSIHAGDLVIAREEVTYSSGDLVAYRSDTLDTLVLHRIVAISPDGHYTFKGDNNSWLDPDHPTVEAIKGKEWIHIPGGGVWMKRIANPVNLGALVFLLLVMSSAAEAKNGRRNHRRRRMPGESGGKSVLKPWWFTLAPATRTLISACAAAATVGLLLTLFTFSRPTTVSTATAAAAASGSVEFSYSAEVTPSAAYQNSEVTSPTPIFRTQTNTVKVNYAYSGPPGTISTVARLAAASGWTWDLALAEPETFDDDAYAGAVTLDLNEISKLAAQGGKATGIPADSVTISVTPTIQTDEGSWQPKLDLNLSAQTMTLAGDEASLKVTEGTEGAATTVTQIPGKVFGVPVVLARLASVLLLIAGLAGLAYALLAGKHGPSKTEAEMIQMQYGSLIVPVSQPPTIKGMVIDVPDIDSLARMAQRYVLLILMAHVNGMDVFIVQDEDVAYRYVSKPSIPQTDPNAAVGLFN